MAPWLTYFLTFYINHEDFTSVSLKVSKKERKKKKNMNGSSIPRHAHLQKNNIKDYSFGYKYFGYSAN